MHDVLPCHERSHIVHALVVVLVFGEVGIGLGTYLPRVIKTGTLVMFHVHSTEGTMGHSHWLVVPQSSEIFDVLIPL
jgi:hypothetical protein